jgi:hypothetical protein
VGPSSDACWRGGSELTRRAGGNGGAEPERHKEELREAREGRKK